MDERCPCIPIWNVLKIKIWLLRAKDIDENCSRLDNWCSSWQHPLSLSTMNNWLKSVGFKGYIANKKILLQKLNKQKNCYRFKSIRTGHLKSGKMYCGQISPNLNLFIHYTASTFISRDIETNLSSHTFKLISNEILFYIIFYIKMYKRKSELKDTLCQRNLKYVN